MIVVSSELPEILRVADRVLVMREGRIAGVPRARQPERRGHRRASPSRSRRPRSVHPPSRGPEPCPSVHHATASPLQAAPSSRRFGLNCRAARRRHAVRPGADRRGLLGPQPELPDRAPNLLNILQQSSINACVALGMTLVIIAGGIDLSVGPTAAIAAVVAAVADGGRRADRASPSRQRSLFGVAAGAINGVLVAYGGLQPFIVTLGTLSLYRAIRPDLYRRQSDLRAFRPSSAPSSIRRSSACRVRWSSSPFSPSSSGCVLNKTPLGEYFLAVGGNAGGVPHRRRAGRDDQDRQLRDLRRPGRRRRR